MDRRDFLKVSTSASVGLLLAAHTPVVFSQSLETHFSHGVASGDPAAGGVVIWTRVTPTAEATPGSRVGPKRMDVEWQVAADPQFRKVVEKGTAESLRRNDHTVKVDVTSLAPATTYFYRFRYAGELSPVGRARTAARATDENANLRFGLASCANYEGGFFSAYRYLAEREDLEFVLHMGDYIYEYGVGAYGPGPEIGREHDPEHEIVSLEDYRRRYALYRTDADLQACHAMHPFITAWDDHEVTNDTWSEGAENHQAETEGEFLKRRNRAYRAYFEWMPIRLPKPTKDRTRIYRNLNLGKLADLHMLDTRQYRSEQPPNQADPAKDDPERTITGEAQMAWLKKGLTKPQAQWRIVGNQLMITPWENGEGVPFNVDAWDGYRADRDELLGHVSEAGVQNIVFLTGDIHTSWANEVPIDSTTYPATPPVAVEMVGPSITSDNLDEITGSPSRETSVLLEAGIMADNPYVKYVELDSHGYSVVDATPERLQTDWYYISDRTDPAATQAHAASWKVDAGTNTVSEAEGPV